MKNEELSVSLVAPLLSETPTEIQELNANSLSKNEKRALKKLGRLLSKLEITFEDLKEHEIDVVALARILELTWIAKARRWLVYDETILKLMLLPVLRTKNIHAMSRGSVAAPRSSVELEYAGIRDVERVHTEPDADQTKLLPTTSWLNSFFYPESNSFLFSRNGALRQVFFTTGVVEGIETITMKVWSTLLLSFMSIDLYYYITDDYFRKMYGNSLVNVFFKGNDVGLSSALTMPTVWPELLAMPVAWGIIRGLSRIFTTRNLSKKARGKLANSLQYYNASRLRNFIAWILPTHPLQSALKKIELLLLWNGQLSSEECEALFTTVKEIAKNGTMLTQLHALEILGKLADFPAPKDLLKLQQEKTVKDSLLHQLSLKEQSYKTLQELANHYQPQEKDQRGKYKITRALLPFPRFLYANYLLWCLGVSESTILKPLFWSYKAFVFYLKGRLLWAIGNGIAIIVERYLDQRNCERESKLWMWMSRVGDYKCTVCGDLPIQYNYIFSIKNCTKVYFEHAKTEEQIISFLEKYSHHLQPLTTFALPYQRLTNTSFDRVLSTLVPRIPNVETLLFNKTYIKPALGRSVGLEKIMVLPKLQYLDLSSCGLGAETMVNMEQILAQSKITVLNLGGNEIGPEGAKVLGAGLAQSSITSLDLGGNEIGDEGAKGLGAGLAQSKITELYLSYNGIGPEGARVLGEGLPQSKITTLYLWDNQIRDEGAGSLALGLSKSSITSLNLGDNQIGDEGAKALALGLPKSSITSLSLAENQIENEGAEELALGLAQSKIMDLDLHGNGIGDNWTIAFALRLPQSQITYLDLGANRIGDEGVKSLAIVLPQSKVEVLLLNNVLYLRKTEKLTTILPQLSVVSLNFGKDRIGDEGAKWLAAALPKSKIIVLDLCNNQIGVKGAEALALGLSKSSITSLNLGDNQIGDEGAKGIGLGLAQSKITELYLSGNRIGVEGVKGLGAGLAQSKITYLDLSDNQIGVEGAKVLGAGLAQSQITTLHLNYNGIGPEGAKVLGAGLAQSKITVLSLWGNQIGVEGVKGLGAELTQSSVTNLDLGYNQIEDRGAEGLAAVLTAYEPPPRSLWIYELNFSDKKGLAQAEANTNLTSLNLQSNKISDSGAKELCRVLPNTHIVYLDLRGNPIDDDDSAIFYCASAATSDLPLPFQLLRQGYHKLSRLFYTHYFSSSLNRELPFKLNEKETPRTGFKLDDFFYFRGNNEKTRENKSGKSAKHNSLNSYDPFYFCEDFCGSYESTGENKSVFDQELSSVCFRKNSSAFFASFTPNALTDMPDTSNPMLGLEGSATRDSTMLPNPLIFALLTISTLLICYFPYSQAQTLIEKIFNTFSNFADAARTRCGFFSRSSLPTVQLDIAPDISPQELAESCRQ